LSSPAACLQRGAPTNTSALVADRQPCQPAELAATLAPEEYQTLTYRTRHGQEIRSRFATVRVIATRPVEQGRHPPREEWLIIEWPEDAETPSDYRISNLPADAAPERLARLARLRWMSSSTTASSRANSA
jgi:hypothetical protein